MIANLDYNFGRLRQRLKALNLDENTILIFMTDNGTANDAKFDGFHSEAIDSFNAGMRGKKASIYDGSHRVPFFILWPAGKLEEGRDISQLVAHVDLPPALADLCDISLPTDTVLGGQSLAPLLRDRTAKWDRSQVSMQFHRGILFDGDQIKAESSYLNSEHWGLIHGRELYDIGDDPAQRNDVAADRPAVVAQLWAPYEKY
jgi:arylsulfatase A-like enzyme